MISLRVGRDWPGTRGRRHGNHGLRSLKTKPLDQMEKSIHVNEGGKSTWWGIWKLNREIFKAMIILCFKAEYGALYP
jgi:hypothetical protein